jgi:preprotein translocase subunit SecB
LPGRSAFAIARPFPSTTEQDDDMAENEAAMGGDQLLNGEDSAPQVGVIAQYVKDFSFENPNAPLVYQQQEQPQIDVQFNIGSTVIGDEVFEVTLRIEARASMGEMTVFNVELLYAGLFGIRNVPEDQLQPFLLAEAPRLLFPFARRIVADATRDGNFPPLMLEPIDFAALYLAQQQGALDPQQPLGHA